MDNGPLVKTGSRTKAPAEVESKALNDAAIDPYLLKILDGKPFGYREALEFGVLCKQLSPARFNQSTLNLVADIRETYPGYFQAVEAAEQMEDAVLKMKDAQGTATIGEIGTLTTKFRTAHKHIFRSDTLPAMACLAEKYLQAFTHFQTSKEIGLKPKEFSHIKLQSERDAKFADDCIQLVTAGLAIPPEWTQDLSYGRMRAKYFCDLRKIAGHPNTRAELSREFALCATGCAPLISEISHLVAGTGGSDLNVIELKDRLSKVILWCHAYGAGDQGKDFLEHYQRVFSPRTHDDRITQNKVPGVERLLPKVLHYLEPAFHKAEDDEKKSTVLKNLFHSATNEIKAILALLQQGYIIEDTSAVQYNGSPLESTSAHHNRGVPREIDIIARSVPEIHHRDTLYFIDAKGGPKALITGHRHDADSQLDALQELTSKHKAVPLILIVHPENFDSFLPGIVRKLRESAGRMFQSTGKRQHPAICDLKMKELIPANVYT